MHAYRFRLLSDENDKFVRDIEIKATQTFKEFHEVIRQSVQMDGNELASFFICDRRWNRVKEITLIDMEDRIDDNSEEDESESYSIPMSVMEESVLKDFIDDPHQRMLYEYDILKQGSLFIELMKIVPADEKATYPVCVKSEGMLIPKKVVDEDFIPPDVDEDELLKEFEEMMNDDETTGEGFETFFEE
ncbi:MAG TPA: hypothetical protein PK711_12950 [Bacteroidales bacterium]|nr:hypothetical protein [Bacteroidales bacterium]